MKYISPLNSEIKRILMLLIQLGLFIHKLKKQIQNFSTIEITRICQFYYVKTPCTY